MKLKEFSELVAKAAVEAPDKEVTVPLPDLTISPVVHAFVNDNPFARTDFLVVCQASDAAAQEEAKKPVAEQVADWFRSRSKAN